MTFSKVNLDQTCGADSFAVKREYPSLVTVEIEFSTSGRAFPRAYPSHRISQLNMVEQANREIKKFLTDSGFKSPALMRGRGKRLVAQRKLRSHFNEA